MVVRIQELVAGDELQIWMRVGLAIKSARDKNGAPYYFVPSKPGKVRGSDLTRFIGWVQRNDPASGVLTVQVTRHNSWRSTIKADTPTSVDLSYTALQRVRLYSKFAHPPRQQILGHVGSKDIRRPGSVAAFGGTDLRAYRTVEDVKL